MKLYCFLATLFLSIPVVAQTFIQSPEQQLVESAVSSGFFIAKQDYCLRNVEDNILYGRADKSEFGISYSVGIKLQGAWCLTDAALHPWEYDPHYDQYRDDKHYQPVNNLFSYWTPTDTAGYRTIELKEEKIETLSANALYRYALEGESVEGFMQGSTRGEETGWIVWLTVEKGADLSEKPQIIYNIYRQKITVNDGKNVPITTPMIKTKILGGAFVMPEQTAVGQLTFKVTGIMVQAKDKWEIAFPFIDGREQDTEEIDKPEKEPSSQLTPILSKEKKEADKKGKNKKKK